MRELTLTTSEDIELLFRNIASLGGFDKAWNVSVALSPRKYVEVLKLLEGSQRVRVGAYGIDFIMDRTVESYRVLDESSNL